MTDEASLLDESDDYEVLLGFSEEDDTFQFWVQLFAFCFVRRNLNRVVDYFEVTVNIYSPGEFQSHFRLTRRSCEQLCQEVINTGHIPMSNRGREHITPKKQVLTFVWMMANQESS